eukprot:TRINITY_DN1426_c5_g1_i1.p1 TRINITY_DN1426_c5_g1~~TRINITY_DN1426_c5_g1_i1.p1  ORF type:complete len:254 (-),score=31.85 TRINITY_DN1426_c5_g1_i1:1643-2404(-)
MILQHSPDLIFISEPMTHFIHSISLCWNRLGFDTLHSNGPSSISTTTNLWCFSKSSHHLSITVEEFSSQHLSMLLHNNSSRLTTIITGVYGSTNPSFKKDLWAVLIDSSSTTLPWCFIGDFNATLSHADKLSIRQPILSSLKAIQTTVMQAGLHDTQFAGNRFTWSNNRQGSSYMAARLDRALVNSIWMRHFCDPTVHHLPKISLDHSPILLAHHTQAPFSNAPFKFENKWLLHHSFLDTVKSSWDTPIVGDP